MDESTSTSKQFSSETGAECVVMDEIQDEINLRSSDEDGLCDGRKSKFALPGKFLRTKSGPQTLRVRVQYRGILS